MRSIRPLILLSTASLLAVAGCTAPPAPAPDPGASTSTGPCVPRAGQITWGPAVDGAPQLIGVSEFVIAADGSITREDTVIDHEAELTDANPKVLAEYRSSDDGDELFDALTEDVRRTGQVPEDFGDPIDPFAFADAELAPVEGRYVMGFEVSTTRVPFEADCGGGLIEGAVRGPVSGGGAATLIQCGYEPASPGPVDPQLRSYC